ncbi:hypothetical protein [Acidipila sp. EB88]|uniref:hypothetical protein n=1 Tax=Acidipila sp. EB88 TaxID=2305226 RepID=UPI000F5E0975|nr:hypothetical protein [Acidipila sp. EB88]
MFKQFFVGAALMLCSAQRLNATSLATLNCKSPDGQWKFNVASYVLASIPNPKLGPYFTLTVQAEQADFWKVRVQATGLGLREVGDCLLASTDGINIQVGHVSISTADLVSGAPQTGDKEAEAYSRIVFTVVDLADLSKPASNTTPSQGQLK